MMSGDERSATDPISCVRQFSSQHRWTEDVVIRKAHAKTRALGGRLLSSVPLSHHDIRIPPSALVLCSDQYLSTASCHRSCVADVWSLWKLRIVRLLQQNRPHANLSTCSDSYTSTTLDGWLLRSCSGERRRVSSKLTITVKTLDEQRAISLVAASSTATQCP